MKKLITIFCLALVSCGHNEQTDTEKKIDSMIITVRQHNIWADSLIKSMNNDSGFIKIKPTFYTIDRASENQIEVNQK